MPDPCGLRPLSHRNSSCWGIAEDEHVSVSELKTFTRGRILLRVVPMVATYSS